MFMLFLIRVAPFFAVVSWAFFRFVRNFFASLFGCFDFRRSLITFCKRGSVGLVFRICFAPGLFGFNRNALMPALATFSAPWIFTCFISCRIFWNWFVVLFFMVYRIIVNIKDYGWLC